MKIQGGAILFSILVFVFLAEAKPQPPGYYYFVFDREKRSYRGPRSGSCCSWDFVYLIDLHDAMSINNDFIMV